MAWGSHGVQKGKSVRVPWSMGLRAFSSHIIPQWTNSLASSLSISAHACTTTARVGAGRAWWKAGPRRGRLYFTSFQFSGQFHFYPSFHLTFTYTGLPMEAIKKKMLAMKLDKENAIDLADQLEEQLKEKEMEMSKKEEEMGDVVKRYQGLEAEKEAAETQLAETNQKLEDTEKRAQERRRYSSNSLSGRRRRGGQRRSIPSPHRYHRHPNQHQHLQGSRIHQATSNNSTLRMTLSYTDFPASSTTTFQAAQQRKPRRGRHRYGSKQHIFECECVCQQCGQSAVMINSMYDFRPIGVRPDPEGCAASSTDCEETAAPAPKSYVPYFTDEPLFSDYGDKSDDEDDYVRARKKRLIGDQKTAFAEAYSASKLNSGTLIQLAIVEAELKNLVHSSLRKVTKQFCGLIGRQRPDRNFLG
ncbi:Tropomyosin-2 [Echinococcus granulosus]|nr:Tropomyosin-2 [Echinococcus granulosus]